MPLTKIKPLHIEATYQRMREHDLSENTVALVLGPRQGERLALCWDDIDLVNGKLRIRHGIILRPRREEPAVWPQEGFFLPSAVGWFHDGSAKESGGCVREYFARAFGSDVQGA